MGIALDVDGWRTARCLPTLGNRTTVAEELTNLKGSVIEGKRRKGLRAALGIEKTRPPWRPTSGSSESSDRTRVSILWAAERVLVTDGYVAFTTRAVAAAAGIKPGNLAYHYKTKRELLRAVITSMISEYARQIDDFFDSDAANSAEGFPKLVAWLIHDSTNPYTCRLFRELWAMALHDSFVAKAVDDLYNVSFARMADLLQKSQPGLSAKRATEIIWLLGTICEGANPIFGISRRKGAPVARITALAIEALVRAAGEPESKNDEV